LYCSVPTVPIAVGPIGQTVSPKPNPMARAAARRGKLDRSRFLASASRLASKQAIGAQFDGDVVFALELGAIGAPAADRAARGGDLRSRPIFFYFFVIAGGTI
jgi:hypothetical protein